MFVCLLAQNILLPRALGPFNYGLVVALIVVPNMFSGLMEPASYSLLVRQGTRPDAENAALAWRAFCAAGVVWTAALAAALGYGAYYMRTAGHAAGWHDFALLAVMMAFFFVNALLLGMAVERGNSTQIALVYLAHTLSTLICVALNFANSVTGTLALFVANQLSMFAVLIFGLGSARILSRLRDVRRLARTAARPAAGDVARICLAATASRLTLLFLSVVSVLLASFWLTTYQLGVFRMGLTVVNSAQYLAPVSAPLLQGYFAETRTYTEKLAALARVLALVGCVGLALAAGAIMFAGPILSFLLGTAIEPDTSIYILFSSIPFFILVAPLSSMLFSMGLENALLRALSATIAVFLAVAVFHFHLAYLLACIAFAAFALFEAIRAQRRKPPADAQPDRKEPV